MNHKTKRCRVCRKKFFSDSRQIQVHAMCIYDEVDKAIAKEKKRLKKLVLR